MGRRCEAKQSTGRQGESMEEQSHEMKVGSRAIGPATAVIEANDEITGYNGMQADCMDSRN